MGFRGNILKYFLVIWMKMSEKPNKLFSLRKGKLV